MTGIVAVEVKEVEVTTLHNGSGRAHKPYISFKGWEVDCQGPNRDFGFTRQFKTEAEARGFETEQKAKYGLN